MPYKTAKVILRIVGISSRTSIVSFASSFYFLVCNNSVSSRRDFRGFCSVLIRINWSPISADGFLVQIFRSSETIFPSVRRRRIGAMLVKHWSVHLLIIASYCADHIHTQVASTISSRNKMCGASKKAFAYRRPYPFMIFSCLITGSTC